MDAEEGETEMSFLANDLQDQFDFEMNGDSFNSNMDTVNHLAFFMDTLAILQQSGAANHVQTVMTGQHQGMMQRLVQTKQRLDAAMAKEKAEAAQKLQAGGL